MLGGLINNNSYCIIQPYQKQLGKQQLQRKYVVIAMANSLAVFDQQSAILINAFTLHQSKVIHFALNHKQNVTKILSIDQSGWVLFSQIQINQEQPIVMKVENKINILTSLKGKCSQSIVRDARIDINANRIFLITEQQVLNEYNIQTQKNKKLGTFALISSIFSGKILLFSDQAQKQIVVLNIENSQIIFKYMHTSKIVSSCVVKQNSIALGDQKGKIWIHENVFSLKPSKKNNQSNQSQGRKILKLQWHLHSVQALAYSGNYLYSGGQQGTVVIWHVRQGTKDFLPRVGSSINSIFIQGSQQNSLITCFLGENIVKTIDMNQDKKVIQYKILVNPDGYKTKKHQQGNQQSKRFNQVHFNKIRQIVCLKSLPGKLQFLNLRSAQNSELSVIQRNYISRLDSDYPNPHEVISCAFNKNWNSMVVAVEGQNHSSLNFYSYEPIAEKKSDWKLVTKVNNPHQAKIQKCLFIQSSSQAQSKDTFLSFGKDDPSIKIWKLKKQKKKSILEIDQQFWACDYQINYRNLCPSSINNVQGQPSNISIVYHEKVIFIDCLKGKITKSYDIKEVKQFSARSSQNSSNLDYVYQIGNKIHFETQQPQKKSTPKKSVEKAGKKRREVKSLQFITDQIEICQNFAQSKIAFHTGDSKTDRIMIYNFETEKVEQQFELQRIKQNQSQIQTLFWLKGRLIVITSQLILVDITHNLQLFDNRQNMQIKRLSESQSMMQVQSVETRDVVMDLQAAQQRWINKETKKRKNLIDDISNSIKISPSFITGFRILSQNVLL